jgi:ADP-heptose:LPS heptosyltransferase
MDRVFFLGCNALGDTLCTTPVVRAFRASNPDCFITYIVHNAAYCHVLDANPDIDLTIYSEHLWMHGTREISMEWLQSLPLGTTEAAPLYHFDMEAVCSRAEAFHEHISAGFSNLLGIPASTVRPIVRVTPEERSVARKFVRRPYAVFSMHSNSNPEVSGGGGAKDWPMENWIRLAVHLQSQMGWDVVAIGAERDVQRSLPGVRNLYGLPLKVVAALLEEAACVVTLENGLGHLAAGVDARMVVIYSAIVPLEWACPKEATACELIYGDPRAVRCAQVIAAVERVAGRSRPAPLAVRAPET